MAQINILQPRQITIEKQEKLVSLEGSINMLHGRHFTLSLGIGYVRNVLAGSSVVGASASIIFTDKHGGLP